MKIALDFDGVLAHTMGLWVDEFNRRHPSKKTVITDVKKWSFFQYEPFSITYDEAFDIFDYCWRHAEYIKPLETDQNFRIEELKELGTVDIVTSIIKNKDNIRKWLSTYELKPNDIIFNEEKWNLDYDIFIDDSPVNAAHFIEKGKINVLYDQPWNRECSGSGIFRIYNLYHAHEIIKTFKR